MKSMTYRMVILTVVITIAVAILACSGGGLIAREDPTATPTKTP